MVDPLHGRRILITRTRDQASSLVAGLERLGALPIVIPTIAIAPPSSFDGMDRVIAEAETLDWLCFTSANAVQAFTRRAALLSRAPKPARIAVIGPATERAIRDSETLGSVASILVPPVAVADSLASALLPSLRDLSASGRAPAIAILRAEVARDHLPETLRAAGATVTVATAYRNVLPTEAVAHLRAAFQHASQAPEAVTFTSSSTVVNFIALLASAGLSLPPGVQRVSIGPVTSTTLQELGLPAHAQAHDPSIPSLLDALRQVFRISGSRPK